jgi:MarR family transcriptional regulator for hemolysin
MVQNDLLFVLHDVARLMRTRFDQRARGWGMTRAQCVTLMKLEHQPGLSQTELAALLEVEPITVARLIDRLEASGMVERRADPLDRRMHRLHLLPAAGPVLEQICRFRELSVTQLKASIPEEDWNTAHKVLLQIKDTLLNDTALHGSADARVMEPGE